MKPVWIIFMALLGVLYAPRSLAKIKVVTTLTDLRAIAQEVGGAEITVESIVKGTQDPHYIEAKPSYMTKVRDADLLISIGLDLETAWLSSIVRGARNPKVNPGGSGYLEVGPALDPLDVISGSVSRSEGDVHPQGNPHVTLDPQRAGKIAVMIGERLSLLAPSHAETFKKNALALQNRLEAKTKDWQARIKNTGVTEVVTYHKTLTYFLNRFNVKTLTMLEPKPGIPPTSGHLISVIGLLKQQKNPVILVENFFDPSIVKKIKTGVPTLRSAVVPVAVEGNSSVKSLDDLYEALVRSLEGKT